MLLSANELFLFIGIGYAHRDMTITAGSEGVATYILHSHMKTSSTSTILDIVAYPWMSWCLRLLLISYMKAHLFSVAERRVLSY